MVPLFCVISLLFAQPLKREIPKDKTHKHIILKAKQVRYPLHTKNSRSGGQYVCMHLKFSKSEAELSELVCFQYSSDIVEEAAVLAPAPAPMCNTYIIFLEAH